MATLAPLPANAGRPTAIDIVLAATAVPFLISVVLRLVSLASGFETDWYKGRAVAETVKSMSWLYMMRAGPYRGSRADTEFAKDMKDLLRRADVRDAVGRLPELPLQITEYMRGSRSLATDERRDKYLRQRLLDQAGWYQRGSLANRGTANLWFWASVALQLAAVTVGVLALAVGADVHGGSDLLKLMALLATLSLAGTAWTERNRYGELANAYAITHHELLLVASVAQQADTDDALAEVVRDAERSMTREHSLWIARRGLNNPEG